MNPKNATIKIIIAVSVEWQWICLVDNVDPELRALFAFQKVAEKVKEVPQLMRSISAIENDLGGQQVELQYIQYLEMDTRHLENGWMAIHYFLVRL